MLLGVSEKYVDKVFPLVSGFLQEALAKGDGRISLEKIERLIRKKELQLWVWEENKKITAALVTEIKKYHLKKVCLYFLVGGEGLEKWRDDKTVENWAKENKCDELEICGRRGWGKALEGWEEVSTVFRRKLK